MYRIIDNPSTGKTEKLLKYANEKKLVVYCVNAEALRNKAAYYGYNNLDIRTYRDLLESGCETNFVIDEAENFMRHCAFLLGKGRFVGYTLTAGIQNNPIEEVYKYENN
jgi:hypothetical protein